MKSVLITGANSGFGYFSALEFARNGYHVYATTRSLKKEGVKALNKIAEVENLSVEWLVLDVTNSEQVNAAVEKVRSLDVLVNNAGFGTIGPIEAYNTDDLRQQFNTNVFGLADVSYAFLPLLKQSKNASIINVSSIAGLVAAPSYGLYSSSKWAVEAFSEVMRYEMSIYNINVSIVEPGGFDTRFSDNAIGLGIEKSTCNQVDWFCKIKETRNNTIGRFSSGWLRDPRRVARKIFKIAESKNPKLRNVIGLDAKAMLFFRKLLPSRVWGWVVSRMVKN